MDDVSTVASVVPPIAVRMDFGSMTMQRSASKRFFLSALRSRRAGFSALGAVFSTSSDIRGALFQMKFGYLPAAELVDSERLVCDNAEHRYSIKHPCQ